MIPLIWTGPDVYTLEEREWSDMLAVQLQTMLFCGRLSIHNSGQWILPSFSVSHSPFVSKLLRFSTVFKVAEIMPKGNISAVLLRCMFGSISVCPRVPEQWWELQPESWESRVQLAPALAAEVQFISVVKASLACRKSNCRLLCCRENTSRRVCVALWFWGLCLGPPESTAVFGFKKEIGGPTAFFEVANPWAT